MIDVGLEYLTVARAANTLSGGESQRIRLATQIGSKLMGVLYILDEPSIGLHQRDNRRLINTLLGLRDLGNTLIVVEHDEETIRSADYMVDIGPAAGEHGGEIIAAGPVEQVINDPNSLTAAFLRGDRAIPIPRKRRPTNGKKLVIRGAKANNLKNLDVAIPLGTFVAVSGVSGSGKSSLVTDILSRKVAQHFYRAKDEPGPHRAVEGLEYLDKAIDIDQSPIGRTPRSNPATYTGMFTYMRELFASLPEAKMRGYKPGRFSFNVKGGRCEACQGDGIIQIEMHFLPDVYVPCEVCHGTRYSREVQEVKFRGHSISDVLELTVDEALEVFENVPRIRVKLRTLQDVGLGYIRLGQPATQLSGGEAQRVKLSAELSRRDTGRTLYLLDEPTTGLHYADVERLLQVLHRLVDHGNTVVVIEHNLDVLKTADWIIDLGPEGGAAGGYVVCTGTPEQVVACETSYTGQALRTALGRRLAATSKTKTPRPKQPGVNGKALTHLTVQGAQQHNLKNIDVSLPRDQMTVCCGPSGSGKSSLALDTIYAEGQRRYVESLSAYARQFLGQMQKPRVEHVNGLSPAISIEQKTTSKSPRSTVGTVTEVYDYLRVLYARLGQPYCPNCDIPIGTQTADEIIDKIMNLPEGTRLYVAAPLERRGQEKYEAIWDDIRKSGFVRMRVDGRSYHVEQPPRSEER